MEFAFESVQGLSITQALGSEWLETNGLGGYASSTILNCHTRKYHGLLVSKLASKPNKYVLLSKVDDCLIQDDKTYLLSAAAYPDCFQDGSFACFQKFNLATNPVFLYKFNSLLLQKEVLMLYGENTVLLKYQIKANRKAKAQFRLRPLFAYRDFHAICKENSFLRPEIIISENSFSFSPYDAMPTMYFCAEEKMQVTASPVWYHNFIYDKEKQRGYDYSEDLFSPGIIEFSLEPGAEFIIAFSLNKTCDLAKKWNLEIKRRLDSFEKLTGTPFQRQLKKTGISFIESNEQNEAVSLVAGYHWFLNWGRDAMIALPGLTLYSNLENECCSILKEFARHEKYGLIPNFIGETPDKDAFNSVDASFWFAWALQQYFLKTRELKIIAEYFWPTLKNIFTNYKNGTINNIGARENGLIYAGTSELNLTWMDAMVNSKPVTARYGYQVEVNALWFNMLVFMYEIAGKLVDPIRYDIKPCIDKVEKSFCDMFWSDEIGYLYDYVNECEKNIKIRPNQILALSLPYSPLQMKISKKVFEVVKNNLFTPVGLRTLAPKDPNYCSKYEGSQNDRDMAYHNGTIWPWMLAHYAEAWIKVTQDKGFVKKMLTPCIEALKSHLASSGIGTISEVFFKDQAYIPDGCISQAWNVAEVLRLTYLFNGD